MAGYANTIERRIMHDFIEIYRNEPSLWKVRSAFYTNKGVKAAAYHKLLRKLLEVYPNADVEMVKRKINALRTNHRKEYRKVQISEERNRLTGSPIYVPSLWYFNQLLFVADQDNEQDITNQNIEDGYIDLQEGDSDEFDEEFQLAEMEESNYDTPDLLPPSYNSERKNNPNKRSRRSKSPSTTDVPTSQAHCDVFGRYVAAKLSRMDRKNQLLSERLISEVLFRGQMNLLTKATYVSTDDLPDTLKVDDCEE